MKSKQELKREFKLVEIEREALLPTLFLFRCFLSRKENININDKTLETQIDDFFKSSRKIDAIVSEFIKITDNLIITLDIYHKRYKFKTTIYLQQSDNSGNVKSKDAIASIKKEEKYIEDKYEKYQKAIEQYDAYKQLELNMLKAIKTYNSSCNPLINDCFDYSANK